jgi:hypothetical protein
MHFLNSQAPWQIWPHYSHFTEESTEALSNDIGQDLSLVLPDPRHQYCTSQDW